MRKFWRRKPVAEADTENKAAETTEESVETWGENTESGKYILIADSGATKCSWALVRTGTSASSQDVALRFETAGLNVAVETVEAIRQAAIECSVKFRLVAGASAAFSESCVDGMFSKKKEIDVGQIAAIWIYAAGVASPESAALVKSAFECVFPSANVHIASDMLGAARSVCGSEPGLVGILGTGSNTCLYDGKEIVRQGFGGGYVLGDEGSGAWFGKRLLSDFIRDLLPEEMAEALRGEYSLDYQTIVENVYRAETPSRYLASFFPFILKWAHSGTGEYAEALLREGFGAFLDRCIAGRYDWHASSLNLCGSVAWLCRDVIAECAAVRGMALGNVVKSPIDGLVAYHLSMAGNAGSAAL